MGTHPRVLVVDDSAGLLRIAETVLGEAGFEVSVLEQGAKTVDVAREQPPDLILLAYTLRDVEGYRVCQQLGEHEDVAGIPIVIMNARGEVPHDRFIRELGIVDHINKPFAPEALVAVVRHTIAKPNYRRKLFDLQSREPSTFDPSPAAHRLADELAQALSDSNPETVVQLTNVLTAQGLGGLIRDVFFERDENTGLTGDLGVVPIAEVVQLLSLQRQSGFLRVTRNNEAITIALLKGQVRLVTGENVDDEFLLGNILIQEKLVAPGDLDVLLTNRKGTTRRLGAQLLKLGYLTAEQLYGAMFRQSTELAYELLRWKTGRFTFTSAQELPAAVLEFEFGLTTDELLMEGFRRVDEWGLIEETLHDFDTVLAVVPGGGRNLGPEGLTQQEREALAAVDGIRTAREIIAELRQGTFVGAKMLYRLLAARVLEIVSNT